MNLYYLKSLLFGIDEKYIAEKLGKQIQIRNGVGFGFVSTPELYHNQYLEIGFGRIRSGYGDWGGGATHSVKPPLKIVIDDQYNVISSETESFYNSDKSKQTEQIAKQVQRRIGDKLNISDPKLKKCIDDLFSILPIKNHVGFSFELINFDMIQKRIKELMEFPDYYEKLPDSDPKMIK